MTTEPPEDPGFSFPEIAQKLMILHSGILMREFFTELQHRGVSVEVLNAAIDAVHARMARYREQYEGANMVQLMIEERKNDGDL